VEFGASFMYSRGMSGDWCLVLAWTKHQSPLYPLPQFLSKNRILYLHSKYTEQLINVHNSTLKMNEACKVSRKQIYPCYRPKISNVFTFFLLSLFSIRYSFSLPVFLFFLSAFTSYYHSLFLPFFPSPSPFVFRVNARCNESVIPAQPVSTPA
jgi:hypothetical protein